MLPSGHLTSVSWVCEVKQKRRTGEQEVNPHLLQQGWRIFTCPVHLSLTVLYCRSLRVVLFGFQVLSAGVAFVIGSTQLVSALANAPRHLPLQEVAQVSLGANSLSN